MVWTSLIAQGKRRLWMSLFVAALVALVYLHFARFYQGRVSSWILVAGSIPVALNLLWSVLGLAYRLDRHPFRTLDLGLVNDQVAPGRALDLEVELEARRAGTLEKLGIELRATRHKPTGRGRESVVLHTDRKSLDRGLRLEPGLRKSYRVSFALPPNAPYSFRSMDGRIAWEVRVEAEVLDWGPIRDEIEVTVAPS